MHLDQAYGRCFSPRESPHIPAPSVSPLVRLSKVVQFLVEAQADKDQTDRNGATPLLLAAEHGEVGVVRYLLQEGAGHWAELVEGALFLGEPKGLSGQRCGG